MENGAASYDIVGDGGDSSHCSKGGGSDGSGGDRNNSDASGGN